MSGISNVNNSLLQSYLENAQIKSNISYKVASKAQDIAKTQGDMAVMLLDEAAQISKAVNAEAGVTMGSLVSGLGQNIDVKA